MCNYSSKQGQYCNRPKKRGWNRNCRRYVPNVGRFDFSRFIVFAKYLNITYVYIHSKIYESRNIKTTYILERREYYICMIS